MRADDCTEIPEDSASIFRASMQDEEVLRDFVVEAREHLSVVEGHALALEHDGADGESAHALLRAFHSIKGMAGILEFEEVQQVAHAVETLLEGVRDGTLAGNGQVVDAVFAGADYLLVLVDRVEAGLEGKSQEDLLPPKSVLEKMDAAQRWPGAAVENIAGEGAEPEAAAGSRKAGAVHASCSMRVEAEKLDRLMDLLGEMAIAQSQVRQHPAVLAIRDAGLAENLLLLSRITREVQHATLGLRMVPVSSLFSKTARLVRDLSRRFDKDVVLEYAGEETEMDKKIAEELADPMMHMIRNAIDHGVETPAERLAKGKPGRATLRLAAYQQGGQIVIEVGDDGRGLNRERILRKAVQNKLIVQEKAGGLSDDEVFALIFEPGFSTAEAITDISGRGVGMDVVREQMHKLNGRIETRSMEGKGTTFLLRMPLTLAIVDALVVVVAEQRYLLPIGPVRQIFSPLTGMLSTVLGSEMVLFQGELLPIVRLSEKFGLVSRLCEPENGLCILIESSGKQFCLLVEGLAGRQEVVIKAINGIFADVTGVSSYTILADGAVALVLDVEEIRGW